MRRQGNRESRVDDGDLCIGVWRADEVFVKALGDHEVHGDLTARPRRGGNEDLFQSGSVDHFLFHDFIGLLLVGGHDGGQLGHVHRAASPQAHHEIELRLAHHFVERIGSLDVWLRVYLCENVDLQPLLFHRLLDEVGIPQLRHNLVGY